MGPLTNLKNVIYMPAPPLAKTIYFSTVKLVTKTTVRVKDLHRRIQSYLPMALATSPGSVQEIGGLSQAEKRHSAPTLLRVGVAGGWKGVAMGGPCPQNSGASRKTKRCTCLTEHEPGAAATPNGGLWHPNLESLKQTVYLNAHK